LQEVLDAITTGARELLTVEVSGLRLLDPDDPDWAILVSAAGVSPETLVKIRRSPLSEGAGGRAILEKRLYLVDSYEDSDEAIRHFANDHLQSAMAAPVFEEGEIVGSLVVASYDRSRTYGASEQEMLLALAEHASIALTDAKTLESMREAHRAKDMFLAMVSHELKTPLTVIMGTLQTFRQHLDRLPAGLRDEMMRASIDRGRDLEHLIDMLLKGARAELAGAKQLSPLPKVIARAVRGFSSTRPVTVSEVPNVTLFVDDLAVHQIVGILLENAVSHSSQGTEVAVTTRVAHGEVAIDVLNQGALPDEIDQKRLFLPFERGRGAKGSGVGLGLHIAARLAESLQGRLEVESADGHVRFTLLFPLESNATATAEVPG
jgi:signal transduction histidine kinase